MTQRRHLFHCFLLWPLVRNEKPIGSQWCCREFPNFAVSVARLSAICIPNVALIRQRVHYFITGNSLERSKSSRWRPIDAKQLAIAATWSQCCPGSNLDIFRFRFRFKFASSSFLLSLKLCHSRLNFNLKLQSYKCRGRDTLASVESNKVGARQEARAVIYKDVLFLLDTIHNKGHTYRFTHLTPLSCSLYLPYWDHEQKLMLRYATS